MVAKYRPKSEPELIWNAVRRTATAEINLQAQAWKEARLNDILPPLQVAVDRALKRGRVPQLEEPKFEGWVKKTLRVIEQRELPSE